MNSFRLHWKWGVAVSLVMLAKVTPAQQPNVLLILTDDQGFGDVASHGNPYVHTPVHDRLAEDGARFERFFVSPVCAPTRASLLTGRYHLRTGVHGVTRGFENLRPDEITLAEVLRDAGYATGAFGKWHNGRHMPYHPNGQGFQTFFGFCGGHWNSYFDAPLELNGRPHRSKGYIIDTLTDAAIRFIEEQRDGPWFCYVPYNTPHSPWRVPESFWKKYDGRGLDTKAQCAYAMVENIDWNMGRLLEAVDRLGERDNTIVLFLTDNGANSDRYNAGMRGRKGSVDEGGSRVPLFIRYPDQIDSGTIVQPLAFHFDLLPTLAEFCGVTLAPQHSGQLDGRSLVPLLTKAEAAKDWPERIYFTENYRNLMPKESMKVGVRTSRWRATRQRGRWQLFDMLQDPGQEQDVAAAHPEVVQELSQAFEVWLADVLQVPLTLPPIPVGHPSRQVFELPANEATLKPGVGEGITYTGDTSAGFANSWIHEWTDSEAYPEWEIDVLEADRYDVELVYSCRREDVGATLVVELGQQRLQVNVSRAHDPPLMSKPDRIYSSNYQDKTIWETLSVGTMDLPTGRMPLRVRVEQVPRPVEGYEVIDLKAVRLVRARAER